MNGSEPKDVAEEHNGESPTADNENAMFDESAERAAEDDEQPAEDDEQAVDVKGDNGTDAEPDDGAETAAAAPETDTLDESVSEPEVSSGSVDSVEERADATAEASFGELWAQLAALKRENSDLKAQLGVAGPEESEEVTDAYKMLPGTEPSAPESMSVVEEEEPDEPAVQPKQRSLGATATRARLAELEADLEEVLDSLDIETEEHNQAKLSLANAEEARDAALRELEEQRELLRELEQDVSATHVTPNLRDAIEQVRLDECETAEAADERVAAPTGLLIANRLRHEAGARLAEVISTLEAILSDRDGLERDSENTRAALEQAGRACSELDSLTDSLNQDVSALVEVKPDTLEELRSVAKAVDDNPVDANFIQRRLDSLRQRVVGIEKAASHLEAEILDFANETTQGLDESLPASETLTAACLELEERDQLVEKLQAQTDLQKSSLEQLSDQIEAASESDEELRAEIARRDDALSEELAAIKSAYALLLTEVPEEEAIIGVIQPSRTESNDFSDELEAVKTQPNIPSFELLAMERLYDRDLPGSERLELVLNACPTVLSKRFSDSMEISAKAAFLVAHIDGSLSLADLIDVSGLPPEEASEILVSLLLHGHIKLHDVNVTKQPGD